MSISYRRIIILIICAAIVLFGGGYYFGKASQKQPPETTTNSGEQYPLLAKRLFVDNPNDIRLNFNPLREAIRVYIEQNKLNGSVYFEYLPTGTSIRVDGDEEEVAASLLKLPAAMELYRAAEQGKIDLNTQVTLRKEWLDPNYGTLYQKGVGYSLSLKEATKIMLEESDNTALKAIASSINGLVPQNESPFQYLDVDIVQNTDLSVSISARGYSSFLKCLYFSCYVNKEHSQEILNYLANSQFNNRLKAGVSDTSVKVAHKIGNFSQINQSDCGIVYLENSNYLLCVMINGPDNATTDAHIAAISKLAFDYTADKN